MTSRISVPSSVRPLLDRRATEGPGIQGSGPGLKANRGTVQFPQPSVTSPSGLSDVAESTNAAARGMALILEHSIPLRVRRWSDAFCGRQEGGRVNDQSRMVCGAALGAVCGAVAAYLFFTERGRGVRERLEPAIDDFRREFTRFQSTIAKVGDLANEGMRAMADFKASHSQYPSSGSTSH